MFRQIAIWKPKRRKFVYQREEHALRNIIGKENYGLNVFEGNRIYRLVDGSRAIFRWEDHKQRLIQSAEAYGMPVREWPFTPDQLWTAALNLAAFNEHDSYHRPCIYVDGDIKVYDPSDVISAWVVTRDWDPDKSPYFPTNSGRGLRLLVTDLRRSPPQAQTWAKGAGNYNLSYAAKKMAIARGLDDAIVLDADGKFISEGSGYAIMFYYAKSNTLWAPDASSSALDSISVRTIDAICQHRNITFKRGQLPVDTPYRADEMLVAGTAIEVAGVECVEYIDRTLRQTFHGTPGRVTKMIQSDYRDVVTGKLILDELWYTRLPTWPFWNAPTVRTTT